MRTAICLHGYFDSKTDDQSRGIDGFEHLKKHVFSKVDADVYIHSWEPHLCDTINNLYKPKAFLYQPQVDFSIITENRNISLPEAHPDFNRRTPETILSHFYSIQKSFELCYLTEIEYDIIIKARFDIGRINRNPDNNPVQCINFDPMLDMGTIKMADWDLFDQGPADMWFYSSRENMKHFASIFEDLMSVFEIGSTFHEWVQNIPGLGYSDLSNAITFYHWWFRSLGMWENKHPLKCEFE